MSGKWWLLLGCLGLATLTHAQQPAAPVAALSQLVQPRPGRRSLGTVLAELARQTRLPLSYSSSLVPLTHRYQVRPGPPRPLGEVLREVLASEHLAYGLLDGQLVVWPDRVAPMPGIMLINKKVNSDQSTSTPVARSSANEVAKVVSHSAGAVVAPTGAAARPSRAQRPVGSSFLTPATSRATATNYPAGLPSGSASILKSKQEKTDVAARRSVAAKTATDRRGRPTPRPAARPPFVQVPQLVATRSTGGPPPAAYRRAVAPLPGRPAVLPQLAAPAPPAPVAAVSLPTRRQPDKESPAPTPSLRGLYLHGEGWASESLPLGATGKIGIPRAYLLLGVALADNGRQAGPAFGLGLGTSGRAWGRFTPNLDVLAWQLGADRDREDAPTLLTQLRPQLSWQVRRGGRLALVAGPTLNLAAAHHRGSQTPRWDFGRDQWLWANKADDESLLRLWPGVQVGVRF